MAMTALRQYPVDIVYDLLQGDYYNADEAATNKCYVHLSSLSSSTRID